MAIQFIGKSTFVSSNGSVTQTFPTYQAGDLLVLLFNSANQAPINNPTTAGYTLIDSQAIGSAGVAGGANIYAWYKFAGASETAFVFGDSGDYNATLTLSFRGVDSSSPLAGTTTKSTTTAATTFTAPGITTTSANALVVHAVGLDADAASSAALSAAVNANLTSLTIQHAQSVSTQSGGGIAAITGFKAIAGASGNTTGSAATSAVKTYVTFALKEAPDIRYGTGSISQASSISATETKSASGASAISQASSISAISQKTAKGSVSLTQSSSLTADGNALDIRYGTASVSQSTSTVSSGRKQTGGNSSVTNATNATSSGRKNANGIGSINGSSTVSINGLKTAKVPGSVSQSSSIQADARKISVGQAQISQVYVLNGIGNAVTEESLTKYGQCSVGQSVNIVAIATKQANGKGQLNNVYRLVGLGRKSAQGLAYLEQSIQFESKGEAWTDEVIVKEHESISSMNAVYRSQNIFGKSHHSSSHLGEGHSNERGLNNENQSIHRRNS